MASIEREIEQAILAQKRWADLDNRMRDLIGSSQEYDKKILSYSIENQLRYRGNLVRFVVNNEYEYYRELLKYSRNHLMLFPYHLSDFLITGMRITPFQYYSSTMAQIIEQEKSYDTLPNFTAADCLRLLGIGRNQYIDIMNELRSTHSRFLGIGVRRSARSILPNKPEKNVPIEPWWFVNAGYITEDDVRSMVTSSERSIIDRLVTPEGLSNQIPAFELDEELVRSLYLKGLIYLDVPIYDDDLIVVPPLEGFVMNRVTGDYFETLLYKIFVSIDQNTPVSELASILDLDIRLVKNAISMYCRLRFAYKKNIYIDVEKCHVSWREKLEKYRDMGINVAPQILPKTSTHLTDFIHELASVQDFDHGTEVDAEALPQLSESSQIIDQAKNQTPLSPTYSILSPQPSSQTCGAKKIVFFYDSNLAAFLMMGNLSSKLKNHAVTMFEVGKLSDEWIDSLLVELSKIKCDTIEDDGYEAKRYYIHALMLHRTIKFIRDSLNIVNPEAILDNNEHARVGLDLVRVESLSTLDHEACERFLKKNYQLLISVAPLNQDIRLSQSASLPHLGPGSPLINSLWFRLYMYHMTGFGPTSLLMVQGFQLTDLPEMFKKHKVLLINHWNREPNCVSTNNALSAINDALTHSPVLVQAYPIHPIGGNLINSDEKVFVPLPLIAHTKDSLEDHEESKNLQAKSTDEEEEFFENEQIRGEMPVESVQDQPAVIKLSQCLNLHQSCGYITLLRSAETVEKLVRKHEGGNLFDLRSRSETLSETQSNQSEPPLIDISDEETKETFILFDCHFGIPLFDRFLNRQVRNRIKSLDLCNPNSLNELVKSTNELNDKIQQFVETYRYNKDLANIDMSNSGDQRHFFSFPDTEQFKCPVPRPAQNLFFHEGVLSVFKESN